MMPLSIDELVQEMKDLDASDLHLTVGSKPMVRRRGELEALEQYERAHAEETRDLLYRILSTEQQKVLETRRQHRHGVLDPGRRPPPRQRLLPARERSAPRSA